MTLSCKHVDDIVIGAPFIITKDLINSLNIDIVVKIQDTLEDTVKNIYKSFLILNITFGPSTIPTCRTNTFVKVISDFWKFNVLTNPKD